MHTEETLNALNASGFIGSWQIDFTSHRMRGTGNVGPFFGLSRAKVRMGVDLDALDRAYLPQDLDIVKRSRRTTSNSSGRRHLRYGLVNPDTDRRIAVHSMMHFSADRHGALLEARGVLFEDIERAAWTDACDPTHDDALRLLTEAAQALSSLGYGHLKTVLQVAFKEVARDAVSALLNDARTGHGSKAPGRAFGDPRQKAFLRLESSVCDFADTVQPGDASRQS